MKEKEVYVQNEDVKLWTENFGNPNNPPILLIMGAAGQGILWETDFCTRLAEQGFFVIRYDQRDTGKSTGIDYQQSPYSTLDMATDVIAILDHYKIASANIVGISMGGQIAQLLGGYFPNRVNSLTLISTSTHEGFEGLFNPQISKLSKPKKVIIDWLVTNGSNTLSSKEEKIKIDVEFEKIMLGEKVKLNETKYSLLINETLDRTNLPDAYPNHSKAMQAGCSHQHEALKLIKAPTLIIHGTYDPIFMTDHAHALQKTILNSKVVILDEMGHDFNEIFYDQLITLIKNHNINQ